MNVVDSCGWLEFFASGPNAAFYRDAIRDQRNLLVPTITLYEVFRKVLADRGESEALEAISHMQQARVVDLDPALAIEAAALSVRARLPMADSIILATAQASGATLRTQDAHFEGMDGVRFILPPRR